MDVTFPSQELFPRFFILIGRINEGDFLIPVSEYTSNIFQVFITGRGLRNIKNQGFSENLKFSTEQFWVARNSVWVRIWDIMAKGDMEAPSPRIGQK